MSKRFQKQKQENTAPKQGKTLKITIPIPKFNLNKRGKNYLFESSKRKTDVKRARAACRRALSELSDKELEELGLPWENAKLTVHWYHPTKRHRDPWNCVDALKGSLDGIVRARVLWDDIKIQPPEVIPLTDKDNPRVEIIIIQIEE